MTQAATSHETEHLELARLPSGHPVVTTLHRYRGRPSGPTVYLQALQHGGEVNGPEVLRRLHDRLLAADLQGSVVAVPIANPLAFDHREYLAPRRLDAMHANMNRIWPGDPDGSLLERMVDRLWSVAGEADAIVDLHTGGPYMLSHTRFTPDDPRSRELATAFGIDPIVAEGEAPSETDTEMGKLRTVGAREGIPTITPELAHSREIVEASVEAGIEGVENVLRTMEMLDGPVQRHEPTVGTEVESVFADASGLFRSDGVSVGDTLSTGTTIGEIYDPRTYEVLQSVEVDEPGLVLSLNRGSTVVEGESVASIVDIS